MDITRIKNIVDAEIKRKIGMAVLCEETGQAKAASEHREVAAALTEVLQVYLTKAEHSYYPVGPAPPCVATWEPRKILFRVNNECEGVTT